MKQIGFLLMMTLILFVLSCNNEQGNNSISELDQEISDSAFVNGVKSLKSVEAYDTTPFKKVSAQGSATLPLLVQDNPTIAATCPSEMPQKIGDLNSGAGFNVYKFTSDKEASAKAFGFEGSIGKKELLVIEDYVRYKNVTCNGQVKKFGIGLRCFIHISSIKGKLAGSLTGIAASVELAKAQGQFNLASLGFGFGGDVVGELPTQGSYDVDNFGNLAVVFNNLLKTLKDSSNINIDPVELP
jgi:hypothetical protein